MTKRSAADDPARALRRSRADVVAVALRLLDEGGLAGLSMRNIATALSLQPSALYWHFPNKQSILAAVADALLAPVVAVSGAAGDEQDPPGETSSVPARGTASGGNDDDWRSAARRAALQVRGALLSATDGAEVVASTLALGLGERDPAVPIARALGTTASGPSASAARTITTYLLGHTQHWQQRRFAERLGLAEVSTTDERTEFLVGLDLLLDGVASRPATPAGVRGAVT